MDVTSLFKAVFALALVLGLILALAYGLRRYAPNLLARVSSPRGRRRLEVLETLVLDPTRRVVIVRVDDEERLILLGEGRELADPRPQAELKANPPQAPAEAAPPRPRPVAVPTPQGAAQSTARGTAQGSTAQGSAAQGSTVQGTAPNTASRAKLAAARAAYPRPTPQDPNDDLF